MKLTEMLNPDFFSHYEASLIYETTDTEAPQPKPGMGGRIIIMYLYYLLLLSFTYAVGWPDSPCKRLKVSGFLYRGVKRLGSLYPGVSASASHPTETKIGSEIRLFLCCPTPGPYCSKVVSFLRTISNLDLA